MSDSRRTIRKLQAEISRDLRGFSQDFVNELRASTPIDTGFARNSWRNIYGGKPIGTGGAIPIARNTAEYIGVLDGQSPKGFTSRQAPKGVVKPALNKTRKKR